MKDIIKKYLREDKLTRKVRSGYGLKPKKDLTDNDDNVLMYKDRYYQIIGVGPNVWYYNAETGETKKFYMNNLSIFDVQVINGETNEALLGEDELSEMDGGVEQTNVPKWESGMSRGKANPIDYNQKWESGLTRDKANSLF